MSFITQKVRDPSLSLRSSCGRWWFQFTHVPDSRSRSGHHHAARVACSRVEPAEPQINKRSVKHLKSTFDNIWNKLHIYCSSIFIVQVHQNKLLATIARFAERWGTNLLLSLTRWTAEASGRMFELLTEPSAAARTKHCKKRESIKKS